MSEILVNGRLVESGDYFKYHQVRIDWTLGKLRQMGARKLVEVGGNPWVMTSELVDQSEFNLCATVSCEEVVTWPDDIGIKRQPYQIRTRLGKEAGFINYAVNIERTLFQIEENPDTILACEIVEHLKRSPHVMLLNLNHWLPLSGKLLMTTPNGAQFSNPFRRRSTTPAYRSSVYARHSYLYTKKDLIELIELCGFKVLEAGYVDLHARQGWSRIYGVLSHLPGSYFKDKFKKTVYVIAEKTEPVDQLKRCPRIYDSRGEWEFIEKIPCVFST